MTSNPQIPSGPFNAFFNILFIILLQKYHESSPHPEHMPYSLAADLVYGMPKKELPAQRGKFFPLPIVSEWPLCVKGFRYEVLLHDRLACNNRFRYQGINSENPPLKKGFRYQ